MRHDVILVDAFTAQPFSGNQAAVCLLDEGEVAPDAWRQAVAAELNLAETAFVQPGGEGGAWTLRWCTPTVEVDLCGHATLAAAHALWEQGRVAAGAGIDFATRSGPLRCTQGPDGWVRMDFPADPAVTQGPPPADEAAALLSVLGLADAAADTVAVRRGAIFHLVEVATEAEVRGLRPDLPALGALGLSAIVTAVADPAASPGVDVVSRVFVPAVGIPEDPVTGSAHCSLASYWTPRLGPRTLVGYQASRRGGTVRMRLDGDRVILEGQAVTVGHLTLLP